MKPYYLDYNPEIFSVHPNVLKFEREIRDYTFEEGEILALFSPDGELLKNYSKSGCDLYFNNGRIDVPEEDRSLFRDNIETHNHPSVKST